MFLEMIYAVIGPWGKAFIEWTIINPIPVASIATVWLAIFVGGKWQLKRIEERTKSMIIREGLTACEETPHISAKQLYEKLYPNWLKMLRNTALYIPHRLELWPVPATPQTVSERIEFTPEWLGQYLRKNGIEIGGNMPKKKSSDGLDV